MIRKFILLLPIVFSLSAGQAADTEAFEYRRAVETKVTEEGLGAINLDRDIFSRTEDHFSDLRLFKEGEGVPVEVPFVIRKVPDLRPGKSAVKIPSKVVSFDHLENGDVEIRVRLEKKSDAAALIEVKTPLKDFEKSVSVSGVNESGAVSMLVKEKLIFDYESFLDFRRTTIALPPNDFREYLLRVSKATDKQRSAVKELTRTLSRDSVTTTEEKESVKARQFRIDEISFYTAEIPREEVASIRSGEFEIVEVSEDEEKKQTRIIFEADRVPFDSLIIKTDDRNFKRRVELQISVPGEEGLWRTIHTDAIRRYDLNEIKGEHLSLSFSEQRSERFRLLIHNRDSPPIRINTIVGVGEICELRFITDPGAAGYALFFGGGNQVERPDYDVAAIEAAISQGIGRQELELAQVTKNPDFELVKVIGPIFNQPWVLWIAIALTVLTLILVLVNTAKHIDTKTS